MKPLSDSIQVTTWSALSLSCLGSRTGSEILAGVAHHFQISYDPRLVRRIAAKVAYGALRCLTKVELPAEHDLLMRTYILGHDACDREPVLEQELPRNSTTGLGCHYVVLAPSHRPTAAIVSLYDHMFRVDLGLDANSFPKPIALVCATDGIEMHVANAEESALLAKESESCPWLTAESADA
jgi:hypothetical protein